MAIAIGPARRVEQLPDGGIRLTEDIVHEAAPARELLIEVIPPALAALRWRFLSLISTEVPQVFVDLVQLASSHERFSEPDILGWAEHWHLSAKWLIETGYCTAVALQTAPQHHEWSTAHWNIDTRFEGAEEFRMETWNPGLLSAADYKARVRSTLELYMSRTLKRAQRQGLKPRNRRTRQKDLDHLQCLVLHQVRSTSFYAIAQRKRIDRRAVARAVKKVAAELSIKLHGSGT